MRTEARFPALPTERGHYESFYLKAAAPDGGRAVWIRHTVHRRPGRELTCAVWFVLFDVAREAPVALKRQFGAAEASAPEGAYIRVDGAEIGPGRAEGEVEAAGSTATWDLRFSDRHETLRHLPAEWMYGSRLPRTKLLSPHPGALFDGALELNGERIELDGWPGMVGHNWGSEHAETWVWIHGVGLGGAAAADYVDIAAARIRIGPLLTPWVANGLLVVDGEETRLGGLKPGATSIEAKPTRCDFKISGGRTRLRGSVGAPAGRFVGWTYADPAGGSHHALNCSVSDLALTVSRPGSEDVELHVAASAVYELGTKRTDHGIPIQPFEDG